MYTYIIISFVILISCLSAFKIGILSDRDVTNDDLSIYDGIASDVEFITHEIKRNKPLETMAKVCELLTLGYGGFVSFLDCISAKALDIQAKQRNIPNIIYTEQHCNIGQSPATFQLLSACSQMNKALADIVLKLSCLEAFILYDESLDSRCLFDVVSRLSKLNIRSRLLEFQSSSIYQTKNMLRKYDPRLIIVFLDDIRTKEIFSMVMSTDSFLSTPFWVFSSLDADLPDFPNISRTTEKSNILFVRPLYSKLEENDLCQKEWPTSVHNFTLITDFLTDAKTAYLKVIDNIKSKTPGFSFTSFNCSGNANQLPNGISLSEEINKISVSGLTGKIGWNADKYPKHAQYQLCSVKDNSTMYHHMGKWTNVHGLALKRGAIFGNQFTDFRGKTIIVSTVQVEPFIHVKEINNKTVYSGFCFDILDEMARVFNFSYLVVLPPDGQYGSPRPDGTWTGMIGMILNGDIDFAVAPFTITSIRESVIDFTVPIMEDGVGILTKKVTEEPYKIFKTLKPFTLKVWGAIGVVIMVVGILLFVINCLSPYTVDGQDVQVDTASEQKKLKANLWVIYGSFLEQAVDPRPSATSGRVMLGFWWVFTILMLATYTANLAAYLTVSITVQPINSLAELVAQDEIKPLVKAGTSLHTLFQTAKSGVYSEVWKKMGAMPYVTSRADAVELTRTGEYAFMTDISQLEFVQLQHCTDFALADEVFNQAGLGFVMAENAPFKDAFDLNIMKMHEAGMMERWKEKWWSKINTCAMVSRTGGAKPLDMDSIAGLFYVYFGIVGVAVLALCVSIAFQCFFERYKAYLLPLKNHILGILCYRRREITLKEDKNSNDENK